MQRSSLRVAVVQCDVVFGDSAANATATAATVRELGEKGVELVVFPEANLTGYAVKTAAEAAEIAVEVDWSGGPELGAVPAAWEAIQKAVEASQLSTIVGAAAQSQGKLWNLALVFRPGKLPGVYAKTHLPELGLDHFTEPGTTLTPFEMGGYRLGVQICYDLRFAEASRSQALAGAEVIALPTNWPDGADFAADHLSPVRANENHIYLLTANRVGQENGVPFIGKSGIFATNGKALGRAGDEAAVLIADLDLAEARNKITERSVGPYRADAFGDRRPDLYGRLTEPTES